MLISLFICTATVLGAELRISNVNGFSSFVSNVNKGTTYLSTTVYLDADLSLSSYSSLNPIGTHDRQFRGTFDGQGHIISGLTISSSSSYYVGLFGYSTGLTVKNVILDSTCSITSTYSGSSEHFVGGVIGYCISSGGSCVVENIVNMADVTFSGSIRGDNLRLGSIAGIFYRSSSSYSVYVKNCVNYGSVVHSGTVTSYSNIGGIAGRLYGYSSSYKYIENCINYGTIAHSDTSSYLYIGGIVGLSYYTHIENCVSAGKLIITSDVSTRYAGSVVGYVSSKTYTNYCYYTSDVGLNSLYGGGDTPSSTTGSISSPVSVDSSLIANLNLQASIYGWNKWLLNSNNKTITFKVNSNNGFSFSSQIILLPDFASGSLAFSGWYTDSLLKSIFSSSSVSSDTTLYGGWLITVYFNTNGGGNVPASTKVVFNSIYGDLPTPSRTGYTFVGWFTETPEGDLVISSTVVMFDYDHTLYAHWNPIQYTISFMSNGGTKCDNITQDYDTPITLPELSKKGYTFICWCNDTELELEYTVKRVESRNVTLYAKWVANKYTVSFKEECKISRFPMNVTYNSEYNIQEPTSELGFLWWEIVETGQKVNDESIVEVAHNHTLCAVWETNTVTFNVSGGDDNLEPVNATYGEKYDNLTNATRTGYTFVGWFFNESSTEPVTDDIEVIIPYPHTLYAHWRINSYTVTFDPDNGENVDVKVFEYNNTITYPKDPKKRGYTFSGWDNETFEFMPAGDVTITAQWEANNYTVSLDVNGGDALNDDEIEVTFNSTYGDLPVPTREGYSFTVWVNDDGENTTNEMTINKTEDHTLYAQWDANNYTVTLDVNGGDEIDNKKTNVTFNNAYGDLPTPSRTGYTFVGWYTDSLFGGNEVNSFTIVSTPNNHAIYAHWNPIQYTISFMSDGESACPNITQDYDTSITLPELSRSGYTFIYWCSDTGLETEYTAKRIESRNVTLYAHWEANNYTVTLDVSGGDELDNKETNVTFNNAYGDLPTSSKTGHTFIGWFTEASEGDLVTSSTVVTLDYDHTLYAHWNPIQYTISFVSDGESACPNITHDYDTPITLPELSKTGYSFVCWCNDTDLKTEYTANRIESRNVTLYARWGANNYTITLYVNGGDELVNNEMNVTFNNIYGILPTPSKTGHTFAGWTDSLFGGNDINNLTVVSIPNNHTLYALWNVNQYTLSFMSEGMKTVNITLNYGDMIIYPNENPTNPFHKFRRWCTRGENGEEECNVTHVPDHNLTFTASFDVDSSLVAGTAVGAFAVILFINLIIVIVFLIKVTRTVKHEYEAVGIELEEDFNERNEDIEERIRQQVEATSISINIKKKLEKPLKKADKSKGVEEILMDIEVDCENAEDIDIIDSYRTTNVSAAVTNAINNEKNLTAAAEYLAILYSSVREQEEYEKFNELYFGMKNVDDFMNSMDEKTICFGGIVSGFTSKKVAIQSLISKEGEEKASMPSGVLFRVQNGIGYKMGKVDEDTDEVLFELCSSFKIESMKEINKDKYIVVNLSFTSPMTKEEMIKI